MVEDGSDDVWHGETEAGLQKEDGVEDVMGRQDVDCGLSQRVGCLLWGGGKPEAKISSYSSI